MKAALLLTGIVVAVAATGYAFGRSDAAHSNERRITFHFSHFEQRELTVRAGVPITFTLENQDPITHEWIMGNEETHQRHRNGTEPYHDTIPSEVTVPALQNRTTTLTFVDPGDYLFICHLPGHEEYGMRGMLHVVAGN
jgi:uncharacterized cupredoxin-like copper-binding protein